MIMSLNFFQFFHIVAVLFCLMFSYLYTCWIIPSRALGGMARPVSSCSSVDRILWPDLSLGRVITRVSHVGMLKAFRIFAIFDMTCITVPFLTNSHTEEVFSQL